MLKIRLQRIGRRNEPHFRVVLTAAQNGPKSGRFYEVLGSYNSKLGNIELKNERIAHWLSVGAQPTDTVYNFLVDAKLVPGKKRNALPKKTAPVKKAEEVKEVAKPEVKAPVAEEKAAVEEVTPEAPTEIVAEETPAETPTEAPAETEDETPKA